MCVRVCVRVDGHGSGRGQRTRQRTARGQKGFPHVAPKIGSRPPRTGRWGRRLFGPQRGRPLALRGPIPRKQRNKTQRDLHIFRVFSLKKRVLVCAFVRVLGARATARRGFISRAQSKGNPRTAARHMTPGRQAGAQTKDRPNLRPSGPHRCAFSVCFWARAAISFLFFFPSHRRAACAHTRHGDGEAQQAMSGGGGKEKCKKNGRRPFSWAVLCIFFCRRKQHAGALGLYTRQAADLVQ